MSEQLTGIIHSAFKSSYSENYSENWLLYTFSPDKVHNHVWSDSLLFSLFV